MVIRHIRNTLAAVFFLMPSLVSADTSSDSSRLAEAFAVDTERDAGNILDSLSLGFTQKSEIQSILLAAMQSLETDSGGSVRKYEI